MRRLGALKKLAFASAIGLLLLCICAPFFLCNYTLADREAGISAMIGRRCIVSQAANFPKGHRHFLPTSNPPTRLPLSTLGPGTILRVAHAERWMGPIDPSGSVIYATAENGPEAGNSFVIGMIANDPHPTAQRKSVVLCVNEQVGLTEKEGQSLHPYQSGDEGFFYSHPWSADHSASPLLAR